MYSQVSNQISKGKARVKSWSNIYLAVLIHNWPLSKKKQMSWTVKLKEAFVVTPSLPKTWMSTVCQEMKLRLKVVMTPTVAKKSARCPKVIAARAARS